MNTIDLSPTHIITVKKLNAVTNRYKRFTVRAALIEGVFYFKRDGSIHELSDSNKTIEAYMEL